MKGLRKLDKAGSVALATLVSKVKPSLATELLTDFYIRHGVRFSGRPNYISSKVWIDGSDYSQVRIGQGATISSYVRVLTHDWSPYTAFRALGYETDPKAGRFGPVSIGDFSFVGTGCVLLPGTNIGRGAIVGAGSAVRGEVAPFSMVAGSPAIVIGDVRTYLEKKFPDQWKEMTDRDLAARF